MTVSCSGRREGLVVTPVEASVDDDRAWDERSAVLVVPQIRRPQLVTEDRRLPGDAALDGASVRVEQQLGGVASQTGCRIPRAVDTVAVALSGTDTWDVAVPAEARDLREVQARFHSVSVEEAELDSLGYLREHAEVRATVKEGRTKVVGPARPDPW